ncbi:conserved unknown protein [Ectocarpus siliculosus]|uniref:Uncharacterized protein n=1 Tax=Ectocarpus siliculosus TaxID=2880 RepID=D8LLI8_ECTSI|nr:conserved unknown protein [Ectocarpus siliculosus]|eukprot:CBN79690.1 conserved unknown protein [Ectocarpus siliculosus]
MASSLPLKRLSGPEATPLKHNHNNNNNNNISREISSRRRAHRPSLQATQRRLRFVGDDHLSSLEQNLTSLAYKNSMVIEKMDQKPPFSASIEQWPQAGQGQQQEQGVTGGNPGKDSASSLNGSQMSAMDVGANSSSSTGTPSDVAAGAPPAGGGPAAAGTGEGKEKTGRDGGAALNDDHPFEHFIANFLDQVPFEAVDVWVPLCDRDQEGSDVVLFHAGYFTNVKELDEWGDYSTNFSFRQGQGIPGRVFGSNQSEFHENVVNLDLSMFLRLNGARKIGIGTSFALPVVSRWGVTFVIVFYTRATIQGEKRESAFKSVAYGVREV